MSMLVASYASSKGDRACRSWISWIIPDLYCQSAMFKRWRRALY